LLGRENEAERDDEADREEEVEDARRIPSELGDVGGRLGSASIYLPGHLDSPSILRSRSDGTSGSLASS
jgi:hypothetical protein